VLGQIVDFADRKLEGVIRLEHHSTVFLEQVIDQRHVLVVLEDQDCTAHLAKGVLAEAGVKLAPRAMGDAGQYDEARSPGRYTGQRCGDVLKMARGAYNAGLIA
jgi:hypothetical protein